jgi:hypothetical protein
MGNDDVIARIIADLSFATVKKAALLDSPQSPRLHPNARESPNPAHERVDKGRALCYCGRGMQRITHEEPTWVA